jgi:hypothetical protein
MEQELEPCKRLTRMRVPPGFLGALEELPEMAIPAPASGGGQAWRVSKKFRKVVPIAGRRRHDRKIQVVRAPLPFSLVDCIVESTPHMEAVQIVIDKKLLRAADEALIAARNGPARPRALRST